MLESTLIHVSEVATCVFYTTLVHVTARRLFGVSQSTLSESLSTL